MAEGIAGELWGIDLGDERLNRRSQKVLEALAVDPQISVNAACQGWSDTLAAYRFFDNEAVTPKLILSPHREATLRRMRLFVPGEVPRQSKSPGGPRGELGSV